MATMSDLLTLIIGAPSGEIQSTIFYMTASILSVIMILYFMYIMKLIAGLIQPKKL